MNVYGELTSAQVENRTSDPTLAAVRKGRLWMRTDLSTLKVDLGGSTDTLALIAAAQTLTNKSIDAAANTITNIDNAAVKAGAGIVYSKLNLAASVKASDMNSQASSAGSVLTADGAGAATYSTIPASPDSSEFYENGSLAASVSGNALTVALKDKSGSNPSGSSPVAIAFRNATATIGTYAMVSATAALSVVAPDTQTLGLTATVAAYLYVYAINNAGTVELALSGTSFHDEGSIQNTTAIASASSLSTIYSTTARTGVAIRLIGRILVTLAASNHWSNAPTEISNIPFYQAVIPCFSAENTAGTTIGADAKIPFATLKYDTHGCWATDTYTVAVAGKYRITAGLYSAAVVLTTTQVFNMSFKQNSQEDVVCQREGNGSSHSMSTNASKTYNCAVGDTLQVWCVASAGVNLDTTVGRNFVCIERVGN